MAGWWDHVRGDSLSWLLETDEEQPGVRYFALRDICDTPPGNPVLREARTAIMASGPVPVILAAQKPEGYWVKPVLPEHGMKYRGTLWQVVFLAQLGADGTNPQVKSACEYVLSKAIARHGGLSYSGAPSGFIHCMAGQLGEALIDLGWLGDPRLRSALDWQARTIIGEGVESVDTKGTPNRYYKSSTVGPLFACAVNASLPCGWGAVKAMGALSRVPSSDRTPVINAAIERGVEFLLSYDPAVADYPFGYGKKPSSSWFKFGYPIGYITDVLQNLETLAALGYAPDSRLARALELVEGKQDADGRWNLEYTYNGKTWADVETKKQPSKWVTLRAIRVLKAAYGG